MIKVTALVENKSLCELKGVHGLALYIELPDKKILFDMGPDDTVFENSAARGIDLSQVDLAIISHGHNDHGGALGKFLEINKTAKVYVQRTAFENHYTKKEYMMESIGLDPELANHPRVVLLDGDYKIDDRLELFKVENAWKCYSPANDSLYTQNGKEDFVHEQNLIIKGEKNVLITGCAHNGIVNIMERAEKYNPQVCIGGFHLFNPGTRRTIPRNKLQEIADELKRFDVDYYTCHCTGEVAYTFLSRQLPSVKYLHCGEVVEI